MTRIHSPTPTERQQSPGFSFDFIMLMAFMYPPIGSLVLFLGMLVGYLSSENDPGGLARNCLLVSGPITVVGVLGGIAAPEAMFALSNLSTLFAVAATVGVILADL